MVDLFRDFADKFGEDEAQAIYSAAMTHRLEGGNQDRRSFEPDEPDDFATALAFAIGFECVTTFREYHGISVPADSVKQWALDTNALSHATDVDFLAAMVGAYESWTLGDSMSANASAEYPFSNK